jgi:hypothetical protein
MVLHDPFEHLKYKLWPKERSGVKLPIWLLTTKSQESTQFPCVQVECDISLESSWQGLQRFFKPHLNPRFAHKIMGPQSRRSPNFGNFGFPFENLGTKCHLDVGFVERHRVYYKGEVGGFPQVQAVVSLMSPSCPWLILAPKVF